MGEHAIITGLAWGIGIAAAAIVYVKVLSRYIFG